MIRQKKKNKFIVAGNHKYKETDSKHSMQSSLYSHPLWVTLYNSNHTKLTFTTNCLSSDPEDRGVEDLSLSCCVLEDVSECPTSNPSLESEFSDPKDWVMDNLFF